ncbi:site-specific integrase [Massilia sp. LC238]|uniref:site-specific integrase n=1 Tax=Massilia sp. LC238 TaxID=1502852 RepID=UPI0004E3ACC3|nr:site-specific integrase [Massilia sp. LC238]KFC76200.1 site-specific tyrosine recombinase XerC [Massilia sp. LC238]
MVRFKIKSFIASDGERFSQLYDSEQPGFPLFYPTAYIATSIRLTTTPATQLVYLEAIKRVCEWQVKNSFDLTARFQSRQFLEPYEIDELAQYLSVARRGKRGETISASKGNTYIMYAAGYLDWLANNAIKGADKPEIAQMIKTQKIRLTKKLTKKLGSVGAADQEILKKRLSEKARDQLIALWKRPFDKLSYDADRGARLRNVVMLRILYETGMRRGELLALKIKHLKESTGGSIASLEIQRNHHDLYDTRVNQPVAKTMGRVVPITPELEKQIFEYITEYRAAVPDVGFGDEDAIFVTHRRGRGQGRPLSISNFDQVLRGLKKSYPGIGTTHPHLLRHDWNFRFSQHADRKKLAPEKEREYRETLMGWCRDSDMSRRYNQRHIQQQSLSFGLTIAFDTERPQSTSDETVLRASEIALQIANAD